MTGMESLDDLPSWPLRPVGGLLKTKKFDRFVAERAFASDLINNLLLPRDTRGLVSDEPLKVWLLFTMRLDIMQAALLMKSPQQSDMS